jgi:hypothetical protein
MSAVSEIGSKEWCFSCLSVVYHYEDDNFHPVYNAEPFEVFAVDKRLEAVTRSWPYCVSYDVHSSVLALLLGIYQT